MTDYPEGTRVRGRVQFRRTDDLHPSAAALNGRVLEFISDGPIDPTLARMLGNPFGGEFYLCPAGRHYRSGHAWWWIPSGDVVEIEIVEGQDG